MDADWTLAEANKPEANYQWLEDAYALSTKTYTDPVSGDTVTFDYNGKAADRVSTNTNDIWRDDNGYTRLGYQSKNQYWMGNGYSFDGLNDSTLLNRTQLVRIPHMVGITMQYRWPEANTSQYAGVYINRTKRCWLQYWNYETRQRFYLRCVPCDFTGIDPTDSDQTITRRSDDWSVMAWRLNTNKTAFVNDNNLDFLGFTFQFEFPAYASNHTRLMDLRHLNFLFNTGTGSNAVPIIFKRKLNPWNNDPFTTGLPEFFLNDVP